MMTYYTGQRVICIGYWRASEASETLSGLFNRESYIYIYILEKWFPFQGERAHFLFFFCIHVNRKEEDEGKTEHQQTYQFTKG